MENKETSPNMYIINASAYQKPKIVESYNREWVNYGSKNDYYQYIIDRFNGSVTNSAMINGIADMIYGMGLQAKDASKKPNEWAQFLSLFNKEEVKKIVMDYKLLGAGAIQVIYNSKHDAIVELYHIPAETLRCEKADEDGNINGYYYAEDWSKIYGKNKPERFSAFGTSKDPLEILMIRDYKPGNFYYSPPDYSPGLTYSELEEEIAAYHISNIQNGFAPSTLINFNNGQVSSLAQKQKIEQQINKKFSGATGRKIVLSFNESADNETTVTTIPISDAAEQYQFLSNESMKKIFMAHRVTSPRLFGIMEDGGMGNNAEEIQMSSIFMENTVIRPFRETLLDNFDKILSFNQISLDLYFKSLQPWKSDEDGDSVGTGVEDETDTNEQIEQ